MSKKRLLAAAVPAALPCPRSWRRPSRARGDARDARYYVALGDSLSTGFQPTLTGDGIETHTGYVDDIYWQEHRVDHDLELVDFGCPGDTTTSLLTGVGNYALAGGCTATAAAARSCGRRRPSSSTPPPGEVPLVTIDIGINDLNRCSALPEPAAACRLARRPSRRISRRSCARCAQPLRPAPLLPR